MLIRRDDTPEIAAPRDAVLMRTLVTAAHGAWGEMTYLVVNAPAFVDGDDVYVDA